MAPSRRALLGVDRPVPTRGAPHGARLRPHRHDRDRALGRVRRRVRSAASGTAADRGLPARRRPHRSVHAGADRRRRDRDRARGDRGDPAHVRSGSPFQRARPARGATRGHPRCHRAEHGLNPARHRTGPRPGLGPRCRHRARTGGLGRQHGRAVAGARATRRARIGAWARRRGLAHRRGHLHGPRPGAAADPAAAARHRGG